MKKIISTLLICCVIAISGVSYIHPTRNAPVRRAKIYTTSHRCKYQYNCGFTPKSNYFYIKRK